MKFINRHIESIGLVWVAILLLLATPMLWGINPLTLVAGVTHNNVVAKAEPTAIPTPEITPIIEDMNSFSKRNQEKTVSYPTATPVKSATSQQQAKITTSSNVQSTKTVVACSANGTVYWVFPEDCERIKADEQKLNEWIEQSDQELAEQMYNDAVASYEREQQLQAETAASQQKAYQDCMASAEQYKSQGDALHASGQELAYQEVLRGWAKMTETCNQYPH